jgi:HlyD family secretion protein
MTVSVDIDVARRQQVLTVSIDGVHDAAGATPWVMVTNDGRAHRRAVKLGARGSGRVEVLEGLAEGDAVLAATGTNIVEGGRVRPAVKAGPKP